jgi:hypothetical protein
MSILTKSSEKTEELTIDILRERVRDIQEHCNNLETTKPDRFEVNLIEQRCKDVTARLNAFEHKYNHDRDAIISALENISALFFSLAPKLDFTDDDGVRLLNIQTAVNCLMEPNRYWYNDYSNRANYV